ncbi:MAG: translation initiation factor IF-2 [Candidatus Nealsonbacteria bacterium]|nr:translation initiation factor IF-2 [Candidatus Nealsonbacteria bacterium]
MPEEGKKENQNSSPRPPIVVVLGHVDSGKTSLLDAIRQTHVAEKESGGITQHVGAYEVEFNEKKITFIDTPGHEAFSAMRSRGAKVADIAILVVDSLAGVQPQTKEAISHVKKSGIGLIVALNKVDLPGANPERIKQQLFKEGISAESLGGQVPIVEVSAKTGQGLDSLLELVLLMAEMEDLRGDPNQPAEGVVIEAYLDNLKGPLATLLLRNGSLKVGDIMATTTAGGKIKNMEDFRHQSLFLALPSMPVVVLGLEGVPQVGDKISVFPTMEEARAYLQKKEKKSGEGQVIFIEEGKKVLNLILKADVSGSLEAIEEVLSGLPQEKVTLRILGKEVGEINESDVKLAEASKAIILGFRVKVNPTATISRERAKVRVLSFDIIYALAQGVRQVMENLLQPEVERKILGKLKVLAIFRTEKNRQIIGGKVIEGEIKRGAKLDITRNEIPLGRGKIISLQENKKEVFQSGRGRECGILFEGEVKIEAGDILEAFEEERHRAEL